MLAIVGVGVQLFPTAKGSVGLSIAAAMLISGSVIGIFGLIFRTPFFPVNGGKRKAMSNALAYISIWGSVVGIVALTWATQEKIVAVIVSVVFVCCLCVVAGQGVHMIFGEPE